jgi:hypothetical protein
MSVYSTSFTWRALQELFDTRKDQLDEVVNDRTAVTLDDYLSAMVPGDTKEEIDSSLKTLERLAYQVSQTLENDFDILKAIVKESPTSIRKIFSPSDCKKIIDGFEAGKTPAVDKTELVIGIYLVLISGEQELKNFDVLDILIDAETPSAEEYQRQVDATRAREAAALAAEETTD